MRLVIALSALLISFGSMVQSQSGPSYEETVRFIMERVNTSNEYRLSETSRCNFEFTDFGQSFNTGTAPNYVSWVNLNRLDPSRVEAQLRQRHAIVRMHATSSSIAIERRIDRVNRNQSVIRSERINSEDFFFVQVDRDHRNSAPRVVRAFEHLIRVCGGREELF